jgi:hypothetical protein
VQPDPFEATRRVEASFRDVPLDALAAGYNHNRAAAQATLDWLTQHYETDPAIVAAVRTLLATAG